MPESFADTVSLAARRARTALVRRVRTRDRQARRRFSHALRRARKSNAEAHRMLVRTDQASAHGLLEARTLLRERPLFALTVATGALLGLGLLLWSGGPIRSPRGAR